MPSSTQSVLIHHGTWDDDLRSHPAMKWMEEYTYMANGRGWEKGVKATDYHTPDFTLQMTDGTVFKGAEEAWHKAIPEMYGPFTAHKHDPTFGIVWETDNGWGMFGIAEFYFKIHGLSGDAVTDLQGEKWDGVSPSAFHFLYVKDGSGDIKLKSAKIFADPGPAFKLMLKNGVINTEQLAAIVIGS